MIMSSILDMDVGGLRIRDPCVIVVSMAGNQQREYSWVSGEVGWPETI